VSGFRVSLDDVRRAEGVLRPHLRPTPLRRSFVEAAGVSELLLKLECWQPTGSFKVRGATNLMASLDENARRHGVVAASAGNHALGVAFAAERLGAGVRTTLFVPRTAPRSKVAKLGRFPVELREAGDTYDDAVEAAEAFERETGAVFVHAFEDARTAAGQGTIGLELLAERPDVAAVVVPVGGGGLIAGVATAVKALAPGIRVVAVQPDASPALRESVRLGRPLLTYPAGPTLADGLSGGIGHVAFDHRDLVDEIVTVSEGEIEEAIVALVAADQVVAEASGAVGVAAVRAGRVAADARGPVAVIVTGGNLDAPVLARLVTARYRPTPGTGR
jgi:threonine dehydratase